MNEWNPETAYKANATEKKYYLRNKSEVSKLKMKKPQDRN